MGHETQFYDVGNGVLGSEEFVDEMIHRIGEYDTRSAALRRKSEGNRGNIQAELLIRTVETVCDMQREDFCGPAKGMRAVFAKEALILSGRHLGASVTALSAMISLSLGSISRRNDNARRRILNDHTLANARDQIIEQYERNIA